MGYFSTNGCSITAPIISDIQKDITNNVVKGVAFVNPMKGNIDGISSSINGLSAAVAQTTTPALFAGITGALATLKTNVDSLLAHTNRISGSSLDASGPSGEPGINGLIGVANSYNSIVESMTGGTEDNFSPVFGSILGPGEFITNESKQKMNNSILHFINSNASLESGSDSFTSQRDSHISTINTISSNVSSLVTTDNLTYKKASDTIRNFGIGNMIIDSINDPCFSGTLMKKIASPIIKDKLNDLQ
tara:strand:+ start:268 stop:1011 length:744 start_codon:yes stop_codon:yes gene_type:complete